MRTVGRCPLGFDSVARVSQTRLAWTRLPAFPCCCPLGFGLELPAPGASIPLLAASRCDGRIRRFRRVPWSVTGGTYVVVAPRALTCGVALWVSPLRVFPTRRSLSTSELPLPSGFRHSWSFPLRCSFPLRISDVEPKGPFHREMRSRTQPATPEPRTHRRGSPAWTPREVATPGRGLRCRQLRTLEALAGGQRTVFIWRSLAIGLPGRGS